MIGFHSDEMMKNILPLLFLFNSLKGGLGILEKEFVCPNQETGYYPDDENICTGSYFTCVNGVAYPQQCPGITVFDPVSELCVDLEVASCYVSPFTCPSTEGFFPVPGACESNYYVCVSGVATLTNCPFEAIFDPVTFDCVPADEASCNQPFDCPSPDGLFPYPDACCGIYYNCAGGQSTLQYCSSGYYFDPETLSCVLAEEASCSTGGGTATPKTTLAPTPTSTSTTPTPFVCPGDGYYSIGVPCSSTFYNCTLGQHNEESCPEGMIFVPEYSSCVLSAYTTCAPGQWHAATPAWVPDANYPAASSIHFVCPTPNGNFKSTGNRLKFWVCVNGLADLQSCPPGMAFDSTLGACSYPLEW